MRADRDTRDRREHALEGVARLLGRRHDRFFFNFQVHRDTRWHSQNLATAINFKMIYAGVFAALLHISSIDQSLSELPISSESRVKIA